MRTKTRIGGLLLGVLALFVCRQFVFSSPRAARDEFHEVATRAEAAVMRGDWSAFTRVSAPQLVFAQYMRGYDSQESGRKDEVLWPEILLSRQSLDDGKTGLYHVAYRLVDASKPLTQADRRAFEAFCRIAKESWTTERSQNTISPRNRDDEVPELTGPAVSGTYASNVNWRIELRRDTDRWLVTRLVITTH